MYQLGQKCFNEHGSDMRLISVSDGKLVRICDSCGIVHFTDTVTGKRTNINADIFFAKY